MALAKAASCLALPWAVACTWRLCAGLGNKQALARAVSLLLPCTEPHTYCARRNKAALRAHLEHQSFVDEGVTGAPELLLCMRGPGAQHKARLLRGDNKGLQLLLQRLQGAQASAACEPRAAKRDGLLAL